MATLVSQPALAVQRELSFTQIGLAPGTEETVPTGAQQGECHGIARMHQRHSRAGLFHQPGALVSNHQWRPGISLAPDEVDIAVADGGGRHANLHFADPGRVYLHLFDAERLVELVTDGSFHYTPLLVLSSHCHLA